MEENRDTLGELRAEIDSIDREMALLFVERMRAAEKIAAYKKAHNMEIFDGDREAQVISRSCRQVEEGLRPFYERFLREMVKVSREYQEQMKGKNMYGR